MYKRNTGREYISVRRNGETMKSIGKHIRVVYGGSEFQRIVWRDDTGQLWVKFFGRLLALSNEEFLRGSVNKIEIML